MDYFHFFKCTVQKRTKLYVPEMELGLWQERDGTGCDYPKRKA